MSELTSKLDQEPLFSQIKTAIELGETNASIAKQHNTSEKSIRRFRKRHGLQIPGAERAYTRINGDEAEAATKPQRGAPVLDDPDKMLRDRGLSPEDWYIDAITVNEWEGPAGEGTKVTFYQAKFTAKRRRPELQILAPRSDGWKAPKRTLIRRAPEPLLYVIVGDQQAPFHDRDLHRQFCDWLTENEPDRGISLGDSVDFPDISRHQLDPENTATVNECLQSGYDMFRGYVDSSPDTHWQKLYGNHDERIRNLLLGKPKTAPLYGIRRPSTPENKSEDLLALGHAMRLNELGIDVIMPNGSYELGQINLTNKLAVRHGWLARKGSGASALATLEHLGYSVIVGHTHRQSIVHETKHEIDGRLRTLVAAETGCMCRVDQTPDEDGRVWPNYTTAPDWQQGFMTAQIWPDGFFKIDAASYVNGALMWRDQRYT